MKNFYFFFAFVILSTNLLAQKWQPKAIGALPVGLVIYSISAVGDNVVWAAASTDVSPIPLTAKIKIIRSSDGGASWKITDAEGINGRICFQIVAIDSLNAWITTQDYNNGTGRALFKTSDGGISWSKKLEHRACGVMLNRFDDGMHWLAINRQNYSISSDNGQTWATDTLPGYLNTESALLWSGSNEAAVVGDTVWHGTDAGRIVRFTNYGKSVDFLPGSGTPNSIYSVAFQDHLNGLAVSYNSTNNQVKIIKTIDGGQSWAPLTSQPPNFTWNINAVPDSKGFYVLSTTAYTNAGRVAITRDFGESWSVELIGQPLNSVQFTSPKVGWIGSGKIRNSTQAAMYKYNGSPLSGSTNPTSLLSNFSVSPNPARDEVRLNFSNELSDSGAIYGTLTDLSGRLVFFEKILGNTLDISELSRGIYFLKVKFKDKTSVVKLVKE